MRGKRKIPCVLHLRKNELYIDFNIKKCDDVLSLVKSYIDYFGSYVFVWVAIFT